MELIVSALGINGDDNIDIELTSPKGEELPPFTPGAHIDVRAPNGALRQYSLCGAQEDRQHYRICVREDALSRGGSRALHADLRIRSRVEVSEPRNLFPLPEAKRVLLFSAGIGITPVITMARALLANGTEFELHHYEQQRSRVAFLDEMTCGSLKEHCCVHISADGESFRQQAPESILTPDADTMVMACGPRAFLQTLEQRLLNAGWLIQQLHSEQFKAEPLPTMAAESEEESFEIEVASSGAIYTVSTDETIAEVLMKHQVPVSLSCEQGMCGACLTGVLKGTPDHRDIILSPDEKADGDIMAVCCSRAKSSRLVLDL
ncbi:PDR/VanB family oxidoreductase [Carnimonas nigrificans]|uniref:PDR/VanB family oxidoreductase n=1 Tax=Carnimonas nigrificans TaxID=64323 RepID=UPI0004725967|nr:PDR/VanB family oxidoreductase [Carnimonas nigrificans]